MCFIILKVKMVRKYKPKRTKIKKENIQKALAAMKVGMSLRAAARDFGVPRTTLLTHRRHNEDVETHRVEVPIENVELNVEPGAEPNKQQVAIATEVNLNDLIIKKPGASTVC